MEARHHRETELEEAPQEGGSAVATSLRQTEKIIDQNGRKSKAAEQEVTKRQSQRCQVVTRLVYHCV
ncbi:hypothetical protein E2C01_077086 [Portunus trituberculatus]|uniref:Uncharacterized protein n=1 Tax=Portunus trituberculatus TaxID=210409 RepID=A0A5B7INM2_PORTR|nr:hypothetical protein [Portunus trituberculatus]